MLKTITLKNFVHFKDKIVIDFDTTLRVKQRKESLHKEATSSDASANKKQRRDPEIEVTAQKVDCSALNIFVGANFCGKSTVIELIRRCMSDEINVSVTKSFEEKLDAYVFCKFNLSPYENVISGIIKEPRIGVMYKVFIYSDDTGTFLRSKSSSENISTFNGLLHERGVQEIKSIFEQTEFPITNIIEIIRCPRQEISRSGEPNWKTIEDKYVSTLPLRGIGMVQWTRSEKIKKEHKESNYRMACERAEVISTLLFGDRKDDVDTVLEKDIFQFITYPERFEFIKEKDGLLKVKHNESESPFHLLKASEGILEAKLTSLLLAHKQIQTLCLEDPDRGMHPQMIERLRIMLHREAYKKTIIVVTHSPYFIDTITIEKTFVFFRKKPSDSYVCSVENAGKSKELSKVSDIETLRTLLFATKVLLVEGPTDREVVQGIFTQYKCNMLKRRSIENNDITTYQIIPVGGCENTKKVQSFCKFINLPCLCLWDLDKVVRFDKETFQIQDFLEIGEFNRDKLKKKYSDKPRSLLIGCDEDFETISTSLEQRKMFVWRHGDVEDVILSSNKEFCSSINCSLLTHKGLKKKLKERLDEEERKAFYAQLMEVSEIQRFIRFMEKEEYQKEGSITSTRTSLKKTMMT